MSDNERKMIDFSRLGDRYAVMLPCEPDVFADFVGKLLGRPQTSEGSCVGSFEIDRGGIQNIYNLIEQRVSEQNNGTLISFSLSISYSDMSSVTLNSYEDFVSYIETKPIFPISITMSWIYLIKFTNSLSPDKQQIDIWFNTYTEPSGTASYSPDNLSRRGKIHSHEGIHFRISHTNRTWGNDIHNLLHSHLYTYRRILDPIRRFFNSNVIWIGFGAFFVSEIGSLVFLSRCLDEYLDSLRSRANVIAKAQGVGINQINEKLDYVIDLFISQAFTKQSIMAIVFIVLSFIMSVIIGFVVSSGCGFENRSFILINKTSNDKKEIYTRSLEHSFVGTALMLSAGTFIGVCGNIAYYFVAKYLGIQ